MLASRSFSPLYVLIESKSSNQCLNLIQFYNVVTWEVSTGGNASDLPSESDEFESQTGHQLFRLRFCMVFLIPLRQFLGKYHKISNDFFLL
jgi:hypothetical protein